MRNFLLTSKKTKNTPLLLKKRRKNWNQKFKGLDKQIDWAAATYKKHYLTAKAKFDRGTAVTMKIDGQNVTVKNAASYSFYKYCPHFNGNKLFYDVWRGYKSYW